MHGAAGGAAIDGQRIGDRKLARKSPETCGGDPAVIAQTALQRMYVRVGLQLASLGVMYYSKFGYQPHLRQNALHGQARMCAGKHGGATRVDMHAAH